MHSSLVLRSFFADSVDYGEPTFRAEKLVEKTLHGWMNNVARMSAFFILPRKIGRELREILTFNPFGRCFLLY